MNEPTLNPYLALVIGVLSVSTSAIFVKFSSADPGVIAFYRLFFSVLLMLPFFLAKYTHELKHITKKDWLSTIVAGVFLAFHFILWFESLQYTSVASSTVLVTLQPLFAFLGTFLFFKETFRLKAIVSGLIAIAGSFLISWGDFHLSGTALFGDVLALMACALVTGYLLFGQDVRKRVSLMTYTFLVYSISSITLLLYVFIKGEAMAGFSADNWIYFLLLALVPNLLGHTIFNWVIKWISTSTISMGILFEPVGASILAFFFLGEKLVWTQVTGGIVVILGVSFFLAGERRIRKLTIKQHSSEM